jgi:hypothetical protein
MISMLEEAGFEANTAKLVAARSTIDVVCRQLEWIERRAASRNRLGMLRKSIEEDWAEPLGAAPQPPSPARLMCEGFYAALGGNKGKSVASPSASDLAARETWRGNVRGVDTLAAALRRFGDKFVADLQSRQRALAHRQHRTRVDDQHRLQRAAYQAYLRQRLDEIAAAKPDDFALFEQWRGRERKRYESSGVGKSRLLDWFDSAEKLLEDVASFFGAEVMSLDRWLSDRA